MLLIGAAEDVRGLPEELGVVERQGVPLQVIVEDPTFRLMPSSDVSHMVKILSAALISTEINVIVKGRGQKGLESAC
ncbi:hypothetical protein GCM10027061_16560 [Nesterenkonia suensis]